MRPIVSIVAGILTVSLLASTAAFAGSAGSPDLPGAYFEPTGTFFLRNTLDTGTIDRTAFIVTTAGWIPVKGDWDGDGTDGIGVFSTTTGTWYLVDSAPNSPAAPLPADYVAFITTTGANWLPITGDWDGDGADGIGIYNTVTGTMFLVDDATQGAAAASPADYTVFMSTDGASYLPITGDWDGNGSDGVGIYNTTSGTMFLADDATAGGVAPANYAIFMSPAGASFLPVAGSWEGLTEDGVGIWQISSGTFFLANDATQGAAAAAPADASLFLLGSLTPLSGTDYTPIVGDWDGL